MIQLIWNQEDHRFSIQEQDLSKHLPNRPNKVREMKVPPKRTVDFLNRNPVDVLFINEGDRLEPLHQVESWLEATYLSKLPQVVAIVGHERRLMARLCRHSHQLQLYKMEETIVIPMKYLLFACFTCLRTNFRAVSS